MCRIIWRGEGLIRYTQLDHDIPEDHLILAINTVEQISPWRFDAIERCVFYDHGRRQLDANATKEAP